MELSELARVVLQTELETMQLNLACCKTALEPECLHDLRVAERRTRAALSEFKGLFQESVITRFRDQLRWLHQATNQLRDLDVGIAHFPSYRRKISLFRRRHLKPAQQLLQARRQDAQRQLAEVLAAGKADRLLQDWSAQLAADFPEELEENETSAGAFGSRRICKRYRSLVQTALALTPGSPSSDFHVLRIQTKKLRYQIEFYNQVLTKRGIDKLLGRLKRFQDILGGYQDAVVQIEHIQTLSGDLAQRGAERRTTEALEQLLASYRSQIERWKKRSLRQARWLASPRAARAFQRSFSCPPAAASGSPAELDERL